MAKAHPFKQFATLTKLPIRSRLEVSLAANHKKYINANKGNAKSLKAGVEKYDWYDS